MALMNRNAMRRPRPVLIMPREMKNAASTSHTTGSAYPVSTSFIFITLKSGNAVTPSRTTAAPGIGRTIDPVIVAAKIASSRHDCGVTPLGDGINRIPTATNKTTTQRSKRLLNPILSGNSFSDSGAFCILDEVRLKMPDKITDKQTYLNRRVFMQAAVLAGTATASTLLYRRLNPAPVEPVKGEKLDASAEASKNDALKSGYVVEDKLTPLEAITTYNNFYEFDTSKGGVATAAEGLLTQPWQGSVGGLVHKPRVFGSDEPFKFPPGPRVYRLRCVEG